MTQEIATLGGGCFWCLEAIFQQLRGVVKVVSGYSGGAVANPDYKQVCQGTTGHAEVVQITFDPAQIRYADLLAVFFAMHDPTTPNRQGHDVGTQYRSVIFSHNDNQAQIAHELMRQLAPEFDNPIVTQVSPLDIFYPAEDYHQDYYQQHRQQPYCMAVISPKLSALRRKFAAQTKPG